MSIILLRKRLDEFICLSVPDSILLHALSFRPRICMPDFHSSLPAYLSDEIERVQKRVLRILSSDRCRSRSSIGRRYSAFFSFFIFPYFHFLFSMFPFFVLLDVSRKGSHIT